MIYLNTQIIIKKMPTSLQNTCYSNGSKAGEIVLMYNSPRGHEKIYILVEDKSDSDILFGCFDCNRVVFFPTNSCITLTRTLEDLNLLNIGVKYFGIKDSDFDRIMNVNKIDNMFWTDGHDIEMMCFANEHFRQVLFSKYSILQDKGELFVRDVFNSLFLVSRFKYVNYKLHCNYCFEHTNIDTLVNFSTFQELETELENKTISYACKRNKTSNIRKLTKSQFDLHSDNITGVSFFEITNGHDFCKLLSCKLNTATNTTKDKKYCEIVAKMCGCFNKEHFVQTHLYQDISVWATSNSLGNIFA